MRPGRNGIKSSKQGLLTKSCARHELRDFIMFLTLDIEEAKKMLDQLQCIDYCEDQAYRTAHDINDYISEIFSKYDLHDDWNWDDKGAEILLYHEHRVVKKDDELYAVRQSDNKFIILKGEDKEYVQTLIDEHRSYLSITVEL